MFPVLLTGLRAEVLSPVFQGQLPLQPARMRYLRCGGMLTACLAALCLSACNREPPLPPLVPVKGKVLVDNELLSGGNVTFIPTKIDENSKVPASTGTLDANGNYELVTGGQKGAPAGKYKVIVTPNMMPMQGAKGMPMTPFSEKYRDQKTTPLEFEVPNSNGYDLKLTKK